MLKEMKKVYHRLLGEGYLEEIVTFDSNHTRTASPDYAIVRFSKKIPLEQVFESQESAIKDWKLDVDSWIRDYKDKSIKE